MDFLLDTNVISDLMREHPVVAAKVATVAMNDRLMICPIVRGEILYGISRLPLGKKRNDLQTRADGILASVPCDALSDGVGDQYAQLKREAETAGKSMGENDLWIAATAAAWGATLVSHDQAFRNIPSIKLPDWSI